jgi:hypothetical protein
LDQKVVNLNLVNDVIKSSENTEFLYYLSLK